MLLIFTIEEYIVQIIYYKSITQTIFNNFVCNYVLLLIISTINKDSNLVFYLNNIFAYKSKKF